MAVLVSIFVPGPETSSRSANGKINTLYKAIHFLVGDVVAQVVYVVLHPAFWNLYEVFGKGKTIFAE